MKISIFYRFWIIFVQNGSQKLYLRVHFSTFFATFSEKIDLRKRSRKRSPAGEFLVGRQWSFWEPFWSKNDPKSIKKRYFHLLRFLLLVSSFLNVFFHITRFRGTPAHDPKELLTSGDLFSVARCGYIAVGN